MRLREVDVSGWAFGWKTGRGEGDVGGTAAVVKGQVLIF
jgi:hypothetical protein